MTNPMKRFVQQIALFVAIQTLILAGFLSVYFGVHFEDDPMAAITDKEQRLKETPSPRLIVVGDSGVGFGIVSPMLEEAFPEYHPLNNGLAAGFGHRILLGEVAPELREGDVVVICLVYDIFDRNVINEFIFPLAGHDPDIFLSLDERDLNFLFEHAFYGIRVAMHQTRKVAFNPLDKDYPDPYARDSYNEYGDIDAHHDMPLPETRRHSLEALDLDELEYAREVIADLNEFAAEAEAKGASVYFWFSDVSEQSYADFGDEMNRLNALLQGSLNFPVLNTPSEAVQPVEVFFDTPYHLTEEGARNRTQRLIEALKKEGIQ